MATQKKIDEVQELRDRIERSVIAIGADYRGLTVTEMGELRRAVREAGVEMRVIKNRLFLRAARDAEQPEMAELLDGPTVIIFSYEDPTAAARATTEYMRSASNSFAVRKGVMDGQVLSLADVQDVGTLPPREIMIGQVVGALQSPVATFAGLLQNLMVMGPSRLFSDSVQTFAGLLEAKAKQLEGA